MIEALRPYDWPTDEHDRFIELAQTLDTFDELRAAFPERSVAEVAAKASSMGALMMLVGNDVDAGWELCLEMRAEGLFP